MPPEFILMTRRDTPRVPSAILDSVMSFRFGDFELAPERYELTRSGARIRMEPRVLEVLAYLVANLERVVAKAELLDRLWHGVVVSEAALTRAVREARRALGFALGRSWIRTVYG